MQRHKTAPLILFSVLWIFAVYLLFYATQKPFTPEAFRAFADSLLNIALALFTLLSGHRMGSDTKDRRFTLSEDDKRIWEELVRDHLDPLHQNERGSYILFELRE